MNQTTKDLYFEYQEKLRLSIEIYNSLLTNNADYLAINEAYSYISKYAILESMYKKLTRLNTYGR